MAIVETLGAALQDHQAGRVDAAIAGYRRVLEQDPSNADALSLLGTAMLQTNRPTDAASLIARAIELSGGNSAAATAQHGALFANLGSALQSCGRSDEAVEAFRRGLALAPELPELHSNLGNVLQARGELDAAIDCYRAALALRPAFPDCLFNLGNAFATQRRLDEAIDSYRRALEVRPTYADALNNLANALFDAGQPYEAIEALRRAEAIAPGLLAVRVNLASALNGVGQVDEAIVRYRSIIADHPEAASAHYNLGNALLAAGDRDGAVESYSRAVATQPDYAEAHYNLAKVRQLQGDLQAAEDGFRAALACQPHLAGALFNLANLLVDGGRFTEATALLGRLTELEPSNARAHCLLGMACAGDERFDQAVASYRRALELERDFPEAHYNLGHVLADCGQFAEARAAFETAIALRPNYPEAFRSLGNLLQGMKLDTDASRAFAQALRLQPLITRIASGKPRFAALLLVAPGRGNTPIDFFTRQASFDSHILLFQPGYDYDLPALRARADVVFNLISDVDLGGELLAPAAALIAELGKPVVNHPDRIRPTDRGSIARTLDGLADAVVPPTLRYARSALEGDAAARAVELEPPVLLRPAGSHGGDDMELVTSRDEIARLVAAWPHEAFYVTRFVDYRSADGYFRKYRLIFIGDEILPYHLAIQDSWKVHYYRTDMMHHAWMRDEEAAFLNDAGAAFAPRHLAALDAIRSTIGLDFFGIDCGLDREGRLVVFEVNASMLVHANDPEAIFAYKQAPVARIKRAFETMLARAAGRASAAG